MENEHKILVVGGAGYIGSHVVQKLLDDGFQVVVFDNFSTGCRENIDFRAEVLEGDILSLRDLGKAFDDNIGVVFHFAALKAAGESMINPGAFAKNNIAGTLNLIDKTVEHNVQDFVFSSSAAVYGTPKQTPVDENHPTVPDNYYGHTKLAIEENLNWYSRLKGLRFAALRYFNATGYDLSGRIKEPEKNPTNLSPVLMEVAAGWREYVEVYGDDYDTPDGTGIRDYIHVDDLVSAHIKAMGYIKEKRNNLVVNLGTSRGYSVLEMISAAEEATDRSIPKKIVAKRKGDPAILVASCDKAKKELDWEAEHSDLPTIFRSMCPVYGV